MGNFRVVLSGSKGYQPKERIRTLLKGIFHCTSIQLIWSFDFSLSFWVWESTLSRVVLYLLSGWGSRKWYFYEWNVSRKCKQGFPIIRKFTESPCPYDFIGFASRLYLFLPYFFEVCSRCGWNPCFSRLSSCLLPGGCWNQLLERR